MENWPKRFLPFAPSYFQNRHSEKKTKSQEVTNISTQTRTATRLSQHFSRHPSILFQQVRHCAARADVRECRCTSWPAWDVHVHCEQFSCDRRCVWAIKVLHEYRAKPVNIVQYLQTSCIALQISQSLPLLPPSSFLLLVKSLQLFSLCASVMTSLCSRACLELRI